MDTDTILTALKGDDPEAIRDAAYAAADLRMKEAIVPLAELLSSQDLGIQDAADHALRSLAGPEAVEAVVPLLRSEDAPVRNLSMDILREIGGQDLESMLDLVRDKDPDIRIFAADILGSTGNSMAVRPLCQALLKDPEVNVRYQAAVSLGNMAIPQAAECLGQALKDEEWVQFAVIEALTKLRHESSVSALVKALGSASDLVASMIVDALGVMGNVKAVPLLLKSLDTASQPLRNKIVMAVVRILGGKSLALMSDPEKDRFRRYLLDALSDEDEEVQDAAARGLAHVGGVEASRRLLDLAEAMDPDRDHDRLQLLVDCLAAIGMNEAVEEVLREGEFKPLVIALEAIGRMHDGEKDSAPLIKEVFWEHDQLVQREMIKTLAVICGPEDVEFFLQVLERHNDGNVLKGALYFLGNKLRLPEAGDRLFALLEHPYDDVKEAAVEACVAVGDDSMIGRFQELFRSPDPVNRLMAIYALGKLVPFAEMKEVRLALEDEVPDIRKVALEALNDVCVSGEALSLVLPRLHDEVREVRLAVVEILGKCEDAGVASHLIQALNDVDDWVRIRAVEALAERDDQSLVKHLVPLLTDSNTLVAIKVAEALGRIGGTQAFQALLASLDVGDPDVQQAVEAAIESIQNTHGGLA